MIHSLPKSSFATAATRVRLESEFPLEFLERRGRSKGIHADHAARSADVALPSKRGGLLDRDARSDVGGSTLSRYSWV